MTTMLQVLHQKTAMLNQTLVLPGVCLFLPGYTPELIPNPFMFKFYPHFDVNNVFLTLKLRDIQYTDKFS